MIRIAIVEDEHNITEQIKNYIQRYALENNKECTIQGYDNAETFLLNYTQQFDLVLMDINLPKMDGMTAVKKIREMDSNVLVIFVTSLAQFAIKGYEVKAFDFVLKPLNYYDFILKLKRAFDNLKEIEDSVLIVRNKTGTRKIAVSSIIYIEVTSHSLKYHTTEGIFTASGTLKKVKELVSKSFFSQCNQCYLVNLKYVKVVDGFSVQVSDDLLQISRPRHKEFMHDLNEYLTKYGGNQF